MHVPNKIRSKLDDKSEKFIFIGYDTNSKGYKIYNPNTGKIIISRDVIFNEEGEWDWGPHDEDYNFFLYLKKKTWSNQGGRKQERSLLPHQQHQLQVLKGNHHHQFKREFK